MGHSLLSTNDIIKPRICLQVQKKEKDKALRLLIYPWKGGKKKWHDVWDKRLKLLKNRQNPTFFSSLAQIHTLQK